MERKQKKIQTQRQSNQRSYGVILASPAGQRILGLTSGTFLHACRRSGPAALCIAGRFYIHVKVRSYIWSLHDKTFTLATSLAKLPPSTPPPPSICSFAALTWKVLSSNLKLNLVIIWWLNTWKELIYHRNTETAHATKFLWVVRALN